jgi:hypothetical protein
MSRFREGQHKHLHCEYYLQGFDQLQILIQNIIQYGQYVEIPPYRNAELEKFIADNQTKQILDLKRK